MALRVNNKLWLISDTHFGHDNIIKFGQRPANHEIHMLGQWAQRLKESSQILHLGDIVMAKGSGVSKWWMQVVQRMPGEKYLILGNHDKQPRSYYQEYGWTVIDEFVDNGVAFTHRPIAQEDVRNTVWWWDTNVHGHTHSNEWTPEHDGIAVEDKKYVNVCVEHTSLAPIQLGQLGLGRW